MDLLAIDALSPSLIPANFKGAGYGAALRYLRNLTRAEVNQWLAIDMGIATIFETSADESLNGATAGARDGAQAARMMDALGQAHGTIHTVNLADFAPTAQELPRIVAYWDAYVQQTSAWLVLPYGTGWLLNSMGVLGWQNAMNDEGWPGSEVSPYAVIYQRTQPTKNVPNVPPTQFDEDIVLHDLPWWGLAAPVPAPPIPHPLSRLVVLAGGQKMIQDVQIRTDAAGCGATIGYDPPVPAGMTWVSCTPLLAAPGTPKVTPATPDNYDLGHASFTVGAPAGKIRVQITETVPNSVRGVRVQFEKVG